MVEYRPLYGVGLRTAPHSKDLDLVEVPDAAPNCETDHRDHASVYLFDSFLRVFAASSTQHVFIGN